MQSYTSHTAYMHFPIEVLKDKIKDLFESAIPKDVHLKSFENGLSHGLRFHQQDLPVGQSADKGNGYEGNDPQHKTFFHLYDNFIQFFWMLTYYSYVDHDATFIALTSEDTDVAQSAVSDLRAAINVYDEAIKMIETGSSKTYMRAARGRLFSLPNPYSNRNVYCDNVDSIFITGCAYLLLHEYGHFYYNHEEDTPTNEIEADIFALEHLLDWAGRQQDKRQCETTVILGIVFSLLAAAYVNPTLVSSSYPDIDARILKLIKHAKTYSGISFSVPVKEMLWDAFYSWLKTNTIADISIFLNLSIDERLDKILEIVDRHKRQYRI